MADKSWDKMTTDEKLDWLRAHIRGSASTNSVNQALAGIDQKIKKIAADLEQLKKRIEVAD